MSISNVAVVSYPRVHMRISSEECDEQISTAVADGDSSDSKVP